MDRRFLATLILAAIAASTLFGIATRAQEPPSGISIIILPTSVPTTPRVGNCVVELLAMLNKLGSNSSIIAYWLLDNVTIDGEPVPAGSIVIAGGVSEAVSKVLSKARECGLKVVEASRLPLARAIAVKPPRIAVLNPGFQPTLLTVLNELGFKYDLITNASITKLLKGYYDLLILPPGSGTQLCKELGRGGARVVAKFVANGGGLIGVCAGAYAPVKGYNEPTSWLQIVALKVVNYPTWALGGGIVYVKIVAPSNPVVYGFKGVIKAMYWNGPVLKPYPLDNETTLGLEAPTPEPLAIYEYPSKDRQEFTPGWGKLSWNYVYKVMHGGYAIVYARYGLGRIVLFSIHPEIVVGPEDTPKAVLPSRYNWRMLWQAIYFVAGERVTLGKIVAIWIWPSALRYTYERVLKQWFANRKLSLEEKREAFRLACDLLARELTSYGVTDAFLQVKLLSGTLIYPSKVGKEFGVPNPYPAEPYNITNVVKVCAEEFHRFGLRLHAWIIVWYDEFWGRKAPMYHCGKWVSKTEFRRAYPVTSRVDLFYTPYQRYIAALAKELVEMGVDGIQLDYIRWPHLVYSFGPLDYRVAKEHGINLSHVERIVIETFYGMPNESKSADPELAFKLFSLGKDRDLVKWIELRREAVENITRAVAKAVRSVSPKAILSAALLVDGSFKSVTYEVTDALTGRTLSATVPGSVWQEVMYGQVYSDFAKLGYWLVPMAYHREYGRSVEWVYDVSKFFTSIAREYGTRAVIGLQAYGGVTYDELLKAESYALKGGADGVAIFNIHSFLPLAYKAQLERYSASIHNLEAIARSLEEMAKKLNDTKALQALELAVKNATLALRGLEWLWISPRYAYEELKSVVVSVGKELAQRVYTEFLRFAASMVRKYPGVESVVSSFNASLAEAYLRIAKSSNPEEIANALTQLYRSAQMYETLLSLFAKPSARTVTVTVVYTPSVSTVTTTITLTKVVHVTSATTAVTTVTKVLNITKVLPVKTVVKTVSTVVTISPSPAKTYAPAPASTTATTACAVVALALSIAAIAISLTLRRRT